jgi:hypothetical protein
VLAESLGHLSDDQRADFFTDILTAYAEVIEQAGREQPSPMPEAPHGYLQAIETLAELATSYEDHKIRGSIFYNQKFLNSEIDPDIQ